MSHRLAGLGTAIVILACFSSLASFVGRSYRERRAKEGAAELEKRLLASELKTETGVEPPDPGANPRMRKRAPRNQAPRRRRPPPKRRPRTSMRSPTLQSKPPMRSPSPGRVPPPPP